MLHNQTISYPFLVCGIHKNCIRKSQWRDLSMVVTFRIRLLTSPQQAVLLFSFLYSTFIYYFVFFFSLFLRLFSHNLHFFILLLHTTGFPPVPASNLRLYRRNLRCCHRGEQPRTHIRDHYMKFCNYGIQLVA
jgi:hypothetical protein